MKIAYTGTHGCGKTTETFRNAFEFKLSSKKSVNVLAEVARYSPFPINQKATPESCLWIFYSQLTKELEESLKSDILICDRSVIDSIAYGKVLGYENIVSMLIPIAKYHLLTYDKLYFLLSEKHDFLINDGVRDLDLNFRKRVEDELLSLYKELGKDIPDWNEKFIIK